MPTTDGEELSLSVKYIRTIIYSEEYRLYEEIKQDELELQRSSSPRERTRLLVDTLLDSLEKEMRDAKDAKAKLKLLEGVKQLVSFVGLDVDDSQALNVVVVPGMMSKDEFNRAGAKREGSERKVSTKQERLPLPDLGVVSVDVNSKVCTGDQLATGPNTQSPIVLSVEPKVYETPAHTHISENDSIWDDVKVEGLDK